MGVGSWWRNKAADFIDETMLGGSQTSWCRWRSRDGHCHLPHKLNPTASAAAGYAVWQITDRGACQRIRWEKQMSCPQGEMGPDLGGPPSPVPWENGGQRDQEIVPARLPGDIPAGTGAIIKVLGQLRVMTAIDGHEVILEDESRVDTDAVTFPTWDPTRGL